MDSKGQREREKREDFGERETLNSESSERKRVPRATKLRGKERNRSKREREGKL